MFRVSDAEFALVEQRQKVRLGWEIGWNALNKIREAPLDLCEIQNPTAFAQIYNAIESQIQDVKLL